MTVYDILNDGFTSMDVQMSHLQESINVKIPLITEIIALMLVFTNLNATFSFLFYFRFKIIRSPLRLYSVYEEYKSRTAAL